MYIPIQFLTKSGIGTISCVSPLQPEKKVTLDLIRKHLAQIFQNYLENPITRNLNMQAALLEILSILLQDFTDSTIRTKRNATDERKQNILRYIWENYQEPLTLSEIADIFHVSNGHLSRVFQEITGKTFPTYLQTYKSNLSCRHKSGRARAAFQRQMSPKEEGLDFSHQKTLAHRSLKR